MCAVEGFFFDTVGFACSAEGKCYTEDLVFGAGGFFFFDAEGSDFSAKGYFAAEDLDYAAEGFFIAISGTGRWGYLYLADHALKNSSARGPVAA